jgi:hypothetical protein
MAFYTYNANTRELLAVSDFELETPVDGSCTEVPGVSKTEIESLYQWDSANVSFMLKAANSRIITKLEYMNRFTDTELATIYTVAKTNIAIEVWLEKFKLSAEINLDDPRTVGGINALEQFGLIGVGRAAEILT